MELLTDKVIYHVDTQEDFEDLIYKLHKLGKVNDLGFLYRYGKDKLYNFYIVCENNIIHLKDYDFSNIVYYLCKNYELIVYKKEKNMKVKLKANEKFVADWYEENKDDLEYAIYLEFEKLNRPYIEDIFLSWLDEGKNEPIQTLVKMHIFGYEIEKEPLYYVAIPNPNSEAEVKDYHLAKTTDGRVVIQKRNTTELKDNWKLTESEIKQDFAWSWTFAKKIN